MRFNIFEKAPSAEAVREHIAGLGLCGTSGDPATDAVYCPKNEAAEHERFRNWLCAINEDLVTSGGQRYRNRLAARKELLRGRLFVGGMDLSSQARTMEAEAMEAVASGCEELSLASLSLTVELEGEDAFIIMPGVKLPLLVLGEGLLLLRWCITGQVEIGSGGSCFVTLCVTT